LPAKRYVGPGLHGDIREQIYRLVVTKVTDCGDRKVFSGEAMNSATIGGLPGADGQGYFS